MEKSPALHDYLLDKNYVVIVTDIPVGDVVEYAVDWVVDLISMIYSATSATLSNFGVRIYDLETDIYQIYQEIASCKAELDNLDYITLDEYYDLKYTHDLEINERMVSVIGVMIADIVNLEAKLNVVSDLAVALSKRDEDGDVTFNVSLVNLGGRVSDLESAVGTHRNIFQQIALLINDPVLWAYELIDGIMERFF